MSYSPNFFGPQSLASSRSIAAFFQNATVSTMPQTTPVSVNLSGQVVLTDATSEASIMAIVGVTSIAIPSGANGSTVNSGRLESITTSFNVGDPVYLGSTPGTLINTRPDIGVSGFVAGNFVILLGLIVKNEFNPANKDLLISINIVGQL